jgi:hypothetical protein
MFYYIAYHPTVILCLTILFDRNKQYYCYKHETFYPNKDTCCLSSARNVVLSIDRGMSWDKALARLANYPSGKSCGFYCSKRDVWGKKLYLLATLKENTKHTYRIAR